LFFESVVTQRYRREQVHNSCKMANTQVRVLKRPNDEVCIVELNTSPSLVNDYYRKTHFIFCMDVSASMDEPAVNPQADNHGVAFISPENTRLNYITKILGASLSYVTGDTYDNNDVFVSVMTFSRKVQTIIKQANSESMSKEVIEKIIQDVKSQHRESTNFEAAMQHVMSDLTMVGHNKDTSYVNEVVVFMTDGCITQGTSDRTQLTSIMVGNQRQIPDWRFIGVGTDFDYLLLNSLKLNVDQREQLTNRPVVSVDFLDNIENAYIIYADVISPYLANAVYNSTLTSLDQYAPVYFGNPTTGILDSKQFHMGIIPAGTTRYVTMRITDDTQSALGYYDSKFHPCHGPSTTEIIVTSDSFVNVENNSNDEMLFNVMQLRQECIEAVGTCYKLIDEITESERFYNRPFLATPRRNNSTNIRQMISGTWNNANDASSSDEESYTPRDNERVMNNDLKRHKELMLTIQQKVKDFLTSGQAIAIPETMSDILKQSIDDISFAARAIDRVQSSGDTILARMVIGARLNSQQYQRAYTITSVNMLDNPSHYENTNQNWSSGMSLMNNTNYSPFTTQVTRSISHAISSQSQFY